jgi:phospholipid/cholesterol/gamma-HCH transport system permease protein
MIRPSFKIVSDEARTTVVLSGDWTLAGISGDAPDRGANEKGAERRGKRDYNRLRDRLAARAPKDAAWDLSALHRLDAAGALLLWRVWGGQRPAALTIDAEAERAIRRVETAPALPERGRPDWPLAALLLVGRRWLNAWRILLGVVTLIGQLVLDTLHVIAHPSDIPWREFSAALHKAAVTALPITGMLGFLIGVVMAYLMGLQLRNFGADTLIINVLGYGILRELGPVLMAVLVAGRSGSAMTAQLGLMRVTEEIDALTTMGISKSLRLVLPKVCALTLAGPLLMIWTSAAALAGGMIAAWLQLDIDLAYFLEALPAAVPFGTLWIGLMKGAIFCALIAITACHFGLTVKPNTESLSARTTLSVVVGITVVIVADAILAVMTREIGVPYR